MPFSPDAPLERLEEALFTYAELRGQQGALEWLEHEARRVRTILEVRHGLRVFVSEATQGTPSAGTPTMPDRWHKDHAERDEVIDKLKNALGWYADPMNWQPRKKSAAPAVADSGETARDALLEIEGGKANGDDE